MRGRKSRTRAQKRNRTRAQKRSRTRAQKRNRTRSQKRNRTRAQKRNRTRAQKRTRTGRRQKKNIFRKINGGGDPAEITGILYTDIARNGYKGPGTTIEGIVAEDDQRIWWKDRTEALLILDNTNIAFKLLDDPKKKRVLHKLIAYSAIHPIIPKLNEDDSWSMRTLTTPEVKNLYIIWYLIHPPNKEKAIYDVERREWIWHAQRDYHLGPSGNPNERILNKQRREGRWVYNYHFEADDKRPTHKHWKYHANKKIFDLANLVGAFRKARPDIEFNIDSKDIEINIDLKEIFQIAEAATGNDPAPAAADDDADAADAADAAALSLLEVNDVATPAADVFVLSPVVDQTTSQPAAAAAVPAAAAADAADAADDDDADAAAAAAGQFEPPPAPAHQFEPQPAPAAAADAADAADEFVLSPVVDQTASSHRSISLHPVRARNQHRRPPTLGEMLRAPVSPPLSPVTFGPTKARIKSTPHGSVALRRGPGDRQVLSRPGSRSTQRNSRGSTPGVLPPVISHSGNWRSGR